MKLVIQIPCFNEAEALPVTLRALPRTVPGIDAIEWLVIDDGSTDGTSEVARAHGVHHVVRFPQNRGLATAFKAGLDAALRAEADIIVNTDADNQYRGADIARLVEPILEGRADLVVGDRQVERVANFSWLKKKLQRLGSWLVRRLSGTEVRDATSGFRAFSREAALRLNVVSEFSYALETIIQAGKRDLVVASIPVETNRPMRPSRLFRSVPEYLRRSGATVLRIYAMYEPLRVFVTLGILLALGGIVLGLRFMWYFLTHPGPTGHVQSLILGAVLFVVGFQVALIGVAADLIAMNRRLLEETLYRVKRMEVEGRHRAGVPERHG